MKEYELWIDESGDFESESQRNKKLTPSLAGGVLIPHNMLSEREIMDLADPDNTGEFHAMEMDDQTARKIIPRALEGICKKGGKLVYFENIERIDFLTNKELYLRVLSAGLCQLVRYMSLSGSFSLDITVAVRYVPEENSDILREITAEEYRKTLSNYITRDFNDIHFQLPHDCRIALTVLSARREARLALADYACNARLVLNSKKLRPVRERIVALFDEHYIYRVLARTAEEQIRSLLSDGDVSGAWMEYFTSRASLDRNKMKDEILKVFSGMSFRLQRLQLRTLSSDLRVFAGKETDFERSEAILRTAIDEIGEGLKKYRIDVPFDESFFMLRLSLADMYLREGDVIRAKPVMHLLAEDIGRLNDRVERLGHVYLYREKKALYEINAMEYEAAVQTMQETIDCMERIINSLSEESLVIAHFGKDKPLISEYLGDAYCMKIYAELFLQRTDPGLFERSLKRDTEIALSQYTYQGELERNQQYRSKAENEAGHGREALEWLLKTQNITVENDDLVSACFSYLRAANQEDILSRTYYAMYYLEIMEQAARMEDHPLAEAMYQALVREKNVLGDMLISEQGTNLKSDVRKDIVIFKDIFGPGYPIRHYHPLEIVLWKYGSFQYYYLKNLQEARKCWRDALNICNENPDYTVLRIVSLAILLEEAALVKREGLSVQHILSRIKDQMSRTKDMGIMPAKMQVYMQKVNRLIKYSSTSDFSEKALALSREIAF